MEHLLFPVMAAAAIFRFSNCASYRRASPGRPFTPSGRPTDVCLFVFWEFLTKSVGLLIRGSLLPVFNQHFTRKSKMGRDIKKIRGLCYKSGLFRHEALIKASLMHQYFLFLRSRLQSLLIVG